MPDLAHVLHDAREEGSDGAIEFGFGVVVGGEEEREARGFEIEGEFEVVGIGRGIEEVGDC